MFHTDLHVYDTTLRDGTQRQGFSPSVADKLAIARHLDELGVGFIEGGWPGANPKDAQFFARARRELELGWATLTAFGATRRPGVAAQADPQVRALLDAETSVITLVAKSHLRHVTDALRTSGQENLDMVSDTVAYLCAEGRRVFLDAEHFFDGYLADPGYALAVVGAAAQAGAEVVALCDTNGGMLPGRLVEVIEQVAPRLGLAGSGQQQPTGAELAALRLGIHCHDDAACAVANTLAAVGAGVTHVQGTANGYGERCGNADLFAVVAGLETKMGRSVLPPGRLGELVRVSHAIGEVANIAADPHRPYVGSAAFAHKAGLHASAVKVAPELYQHLDPASVGNDMRMLVSELAGRATVELKGRELGLELDRAVAGRVVEHVKQREANGYTYEAAEASFELLLRGELDGAAPRFFELESWRVSVEQRADGVLTSEATVKLRVDGERIVAIGEGNGPVNALDTALRTALAGRYPQLGELELTDYKVRILDGGHGTGAVTRVLVTTADAQREWATIGVHENILGASWDALDDAVTYGLLAAARRDAGGQGRAASTAERLEEPA